jgi:3-deoxy-manno-octulosonate cytidylyltransferase (CMP-KDO synthetase)
MPQDAEFIVVIPARFGASRLPGKPLREIAGEPMIAHVARRALEAGAREVVLATDDARIGAAVAGLPVTVCMTRAGHQSGTDRIAECAARLRWDPALIVVNLQGDEPFAPAEGIRAVARTLAASDAEMATLAAPFDDMDTLFDPNVVKLVRDAQGLALYFSRAPVPLAPGPAGPRPGLTAGNAGAAAHRDLCIPRRFPASVRRAAAEPPGARGGARAVARARGWIPNRGGHHPGALSERRGYAGGPGRGRQAGAQRRLTVGLASGGVSQLSWPRR